MAELAFDSVNLNLGQSFKGACPSIMKTFPVWKRGPDGPGTYFLWIGYVENQQVTPKMDQRL